MGEGPSHDAVVAALERRIGRYLQLYPVGRLHVVPQELRFADGTVVEPDLFVVPSGGGPPLLAGEVMAPATRRADRVVKRALYQRHRVAEYWILDADAALLERWRPDDTRPEVLDETVEWRPDPGRPMLVIDLPRFFAEAGK